MTLTHLDNLRLLRNRFQALAAYHERLAKSAKYRQQISHQASARAYRAAARRVGKVMGGTA